MKKILFLLFSVISLCSCEEKFSNEQAKEAIKQYYNEASLAAGGGTFHIDTVEIISSEKQNDETWTVKARVTGTHENFSLAENQGPFPIDYENTYKIVKQDNIWKVTYIE